MLNYIFWLPTRPPPMGIVLLKCHYIFEFSLKACLSRTSFRVANYWKRSIENSAVSSIQLFEEIVFDSN
jgi:hypothetical protein